MAYVALARKYRPQKLSEVIGQDAVVRTLSNAITLGRIHHAYLFTGARGVGKTSIARILAKSLNCQKGPTIDACGLCTSCVEITRSSSPDVLEIDGASNTSVDDVRALRETVQYLPAHGRHKVYIIDEVHMLSTSAFNALLKTLEEPPPHVIFVFATTEPHKIPVTILSRCQRFDFRRVSQSVLGERLKQVIESEHLHFQPEAIALVAKAADGSVRDSMSLLDQVIAFAGDNITSDQARDALGLLDREKVHQLLAALLGRQREKISTLVAGAYEGGVDLGEIAERLVEALRDVTLTKLTHGRAESLSGLTADELNALNGVAAQHSEADLHRLFSIVVKTAEETAHSPFAHLVFEMGLLRACDLEPVRALSDIINDLRNGHFPERTHAPAAASVVAPVTQPAAAPRTLPAGVALTPNSSFPIARAPSVTAVSAPAATPVPPAPVVSAPATAVSPVALTPAPVAPSASPSPALGPPRDFRDLANRINALKPRLGAALENLVCNDFTVHKMTLTIPAGKEVFGDMLLDAEGLAELHVLAQRLFGHTFSITVEKAVDNGQVPMASIADERRQIRQNEVSDLKRSAVEHPAVRQVLDHLGGEVHKVQITAALSHAPEDYE